MAKKKDNKLEEPLKSAERLANEADWADYEHKNQFSLSCILSADAGSESLSVEWRDKARKDRSCVYALVIRGKIFKIGAALRGMKGRIGSYNTGKVKYRVRGTNSGTNYWCLQSFINMNAPVEVYAHYPEMQTGEAFGERIREAFPSAKAIEGIVIKLFVKKYGKKPIGCTQG